MSAPQLDTSGLVMLPRPGAPQYSDGWGFEHLTPFAQGYVEAMLRVCEAISTARPRGPTERPMLRSMILNMRSAAFSDLAPETLARIIEDCERFVGDPSTNRADNGAACWRMRNRSPHRFFFQEQFPDDGPLTPYLGDDGKVYLREAGQ